MLAIVFLLARGTGICQHPNIRVSPPGGAPEEVTIAVNPLNSSILAAGANITSFYRSTDRGLTWTSSSMVSPSFGVWGDPVVMYDAGGVLYYGHLSNPPSPGYWIDRIVVQRSTDGGLSWNDGAGIGFSPPLRNQDKEWLASDITTSRWSGNVYVAWTEFDRYGSPSPADSSRILISRSTDQGVSWSDPVRVSDLAGNCLDGDSTVEGAVPAIGPEGQVYIAWSGPAGIMFDRSLDGGQSWGDDVAVTAQPGGWDYAIPGIYRCNGMPVTACDAGLSRFRGNIYINWTDQRNGPDNTDVFLIRSTDGGAHWGPVIKVNDDSSGRQQFFSWMAVDQSDGSVNIVFYDRRKTSGNATDVTLARSIDGGMTFRNTIISDSSFIPREGVFFGDYTNIAAANGMLYPIWMRLDSASSELSVWIAPVRTGMRTTFQTRAGWNLVSLPVLSVDSAATAIVSTSISGAYSYAGRYSPARYLKPGTGYWLKFPSDRSMEITGDSLTGDTLVLNPGWNMIGGLSTPIAVSSMLQSPEGSVVSACYRYNGSFYSAADTLTPGLGYWIKCRNACTIVRSSYPVTGNIRITAGRLAELPPLPPDEITASATPHSVALLQNYPNPFNPSTTIRYILSDAAYVTISVYDLLGRLVATPVHEFQQEGDHSVLFSAAGVTERQHVPLPAGVYYYRLQAGTAIQTKSMVLIR